MFWNYFFRVLFSLPVLGITFFGLYMLKTKKPFFYAVKKQFCFLALSLLLAIPPFIALFVTGDWSFLTIAIFYCLFFVILLVKTIANKDEKYVLMGVDKNIHSVFKHFLEKHKVAFIEDLGFALSDRKAIVQIHYQKRRNVSSIVVKGEPNTELMEEILHEVTNYYYETKSKAYKKDALLYTWSGLILFFLFILPEAFGILL